MPLCAGLAGLRILQCGGGYAFSLGIRVQIHAWYLAEYSTSASNRLTAQPARRLEEQAASVDFCLGLIVNVQQMCVFCESPRDGAK